jgi:hypothetical protein
MGMPKSDEGPYCAKCRERDQLSILNLTRGRVESFGFNAHIPPLEFPVPPSVCYLCNTCGHQGTVSVGDMWRP